MPRLKEIAFETAIIERYRRRESSVEEALIDRPLQGGRYSYVYVDGIYLRRNWDAGERAKIAVESYDAEDIWRPGCSVARPASCHGLQSFGKYLSHVSYIRSLWDSFHFHLTLHPFV